jgi:hypothetical protein
MASSTKMRELICVILETRVKGHKVWRGEGVGVCLGKRLHSGCLFVHGLPGQANLALIEKAGPHSCFKRLVEICVGENNICILPAEL